MLCRNRLLYQLLHERSCSIWEVADPVSELNYWVGVGAVVVISHLAIGSGDVAGSGFGLRAPLGSDCQ